HAHVVKVASSYFARHISKHYRARKVIFIPRCVDFSLFNGLKKRSQHNGPLVIGYEGSEQEGACKPRTEALEAIMRRYGKQVRLEFHGYMPPVFQGHPAVSHLRDRMDYRAYLKRLYTAGWDIGLAPLENTLMHRCKTNNKFREYGACGIPG